jgi:DNA-binding NtrC family response regulator
MSARPLLLLIEDEALVALALQDALEDAGYDVLWAENGISGAVAMASNLENVSSLITDIRLGDGPDGWALAKQARSHRPELPVLYVTGDSAPDWLDQGVADSALLQKPFASNQLLASLATIIA